MFKNSYLIVVFSIMTQACFTDGDSRIIPDDDTQTKTSLEAELITDETKKFFITTVNDSNLAQLSVSLSDEFGSINIEKTLPSSASLLVVTSTNDYDLIRASNYGFEITDYYAYNQTSDFDEIMTWSRFFVSEQDALQWKNDIEAMKNLMPNDEVSINLVGIETMGVVDTNETTALDNQSLKININSEQSWTYLRVIYGDDSIIGSIYAGSETYEFWFKGDEGYVIPQYELKYLQGAFELD